MDTKNTSVEKK